MHIRDIKFDEDGQARVTLCKMLDWLEEGKENEDLPYRLKQAG